MKSKPNSLRRRILPLLDNSKITADALNLKQAIYDLHQKLDAIHFEATHKGVNERISFRAVCIRPKPMQQESLTRYGQEFKAVKVQGGAIKITVTSLPTGYVKFQHTQEQYDPNEVYSLHDFTENLSEYQRTVLLQLYNDCNPRPMSDLVQGNGPTLAIATIQFHCSPEHLLSGLVEIIYAMRNTLLHGEVEPDAQVLACYEPAYRIVMQFLACVR